MQTVKRLIDQFIPSHYSLSLTLDRRERAFRGIVTIKGVLQTESKQIALHSKNLKIESVTLDGKHATFAEAGNDELTILHPDLTPGKHLIVIAFSGKITDPMHGLYPCYYEHNDAKKELLATQFESHYAREVFPCIDEPEAKATFDLTLTTEKDITVLGNQPVKSQRIENDLLVTTFETTPKMSTYLLAWVAGELHRKTTKTSSGIEVSVWATPAQSAASLDFGLDIAKRAIEFYEQYFGVPYPLPKSDHVAVPDFTNGAMENWGLITYRETVLLADPKTTGISSRQSIALVITHELAHQWFGNLVTMRWWDNLWLNESFASLMEYIATDSLFPDWSIWLDFETHESISALRRDSIEGVQPVQTDVQHPDQIGTLFDGAIVYAKGARLLRMLQHYVGAKVFQAGLRRYFTDYAYGSTEGDDLWLAIAEASGKDVAGLMNVWISQSGYPVVRISQNNKSINLSQEQFFIGPHKPSTRFWPIPLNASTDELPELFTKKSLAIERNGAGPIRLNLGDISHFVSHYDTDTLKHLLANIQSGSTHEIDRLQLLHESVLLARAGILKTAQIIDILIAYKSETSEHVWEMIFIALKEFRKFVENDETTENKLRKFSAQIAKNEYHRLGWSAKPDESDDDTKLRATIISLTLYGEDAEAISAAQGLYDNNSLEELDAELRPLILRSVVHHSDDRIVDELLSRYIASQSGELRQDISIGITSTRIPEKIDELLSIIKDTKIVRTQDTLRWFIYLLRGEDSQVATWKWLRSNWGWIVDTFNSDKSYDDYPRYSASILATKDQLHEYTQFFLPLKEDLALTRVIEMGISEIEGRVELIERDGPAVRQALLDL
jgi:aminopeptidase N